MRLLCQAPSGLHSPKRVDAGPLTLVGDVFFEAAVEPIRQSSASKSFSVSRLDPSALRILPRQLQ